MTVQRTTASDQAMVDDEDCFDAGCTAMGLWDQRSGLRTLTASTSPRIRLEGEILTPERLKIPSDQSNEA